MENGSLSFTELVFNASLPVQLVMLFLLALSVISWTIIFQRAVQFKKSRQKADEFEDRFWSGVDLNSLYQDCIKRQASLVGLEVIYAAGFKEFVRLVTSGPAAQEVVMDGTYRQMKVASNRELETLETHLTTLATIGSISPYIGLFGTVWGIMHAFVALAAVKNATLAMVAPPIAEALIATAMGLFAAIPAVMCYNRFASRLDAFENRYLNFMDEFATILNRRLVTIRSLPREAYAPQTQEPSAYVREQDAKEAGSAETSVPVGGAVPPRRPDEDKEARLPENAARRESFEYSDAPLKNAGTHVNPGIFSEVGGKSSAGKETKIAAETSASAAKSEGDGPQYRVGSLRERPVFRQASDGTPAVRNSGAAGKTRAEDPASANASGPHYAVGPSERQKAALAQQRAAQPKEEPHYVVGPSRSQLEAQQRRMQESSPAPQYRVGPSRERLNAQMQAQEPQGEPQYRVGPRPLSAAEEEERRRRLNEGPRYVTPGARVSSVTGNPAPEGRTLAGSESNPLNRDASALRKH